MLAPVIAMNASRKPNILNRTLVHTFYISAGIGTIAIVSLTLSVLHEEQAIIGNAWVIVWISIMLICMGLAGFVGGAAVLWQVLGPLAAKFQGWPFGVGDNVWILSGPYKGTMTTVYCVWYERGQVRLNLGEAAGKNCTDVFNGITVCLARRAAKNETGSAPEP